jgi:hypothetical protein
MATRKYGRYQSIIVLGCDHAGLRPKFQSLEDEINRAVNAMEEPRRVQEYLEHMRAESAFWTQQFLSDRSGK